MLDDSPLGIKNLYLWRMESEGKVILCKQLTFHRYVNITFFCQTQWCDNKIENGDVDIGWSVYVCVKYEMLINAIFELLMYKQGNPIVRFILSKIVWNMVFIVFYYKIHNLIFSWFFGWPELQLDLFLLSGHLCGKIWRISSNYYRIKMGVFLLWINCDQFNDTKSNIFK